MAKRPHCCALLLGASLILLAMVLAVRVQRAAHSPRAAQTARVAEGVTHLQAGCLTCHQLPPLSAVAFTAPLTHAFAEQPDWQTVRLAVSPVTPQAHAQDRLIDLGQRLLALPENLAGHQDQAAKSFLQAVDAVQSAGKLDPAAMQRLFVHLDQLEALLQALETQASPYQWKTQPHRVLPVQVTLGNNPHGASSAVLLAGPVRLIAATADPARVPDDPRLYVRPLEIVFASERHGPPAGRFLDSAWSGRLLT